MFPNGSSIRMCPWWGLEGITLSTVIREHIASYLPQTYRACSLKSNTDCMVLNEFHSVFVLHLFSGFTRSLLDKCSTSEKDNHQLSLLPHKKISSTFIIKHDSTGFMSKTSAASLSKLWQFTELLQTDWMPNRCCVCKSQLKWIHSCSLLFFKQAYHTGCGCHIWNNKRHHWWTFFIIS